VAFLLIKSVLLSDAKPNPPATALGASARASLLWGGGFTLMRDIAQFGVMLILVRLLTPVDYGTAALAQAIVGVVSVISYATFSSHALQLRNPDDIDWQAHFTSAAVLNTVLAGFVLVLAFGLSFSEQYTEAALPLAALSVVFLIEIPGTLRHRMLEAHHDWARFRLLVTIGTLLGLGSGLLVGLVGGGVWALIVQVPMLGLPAAIDLLIFQRFRPDWSWSRARWRDTFRFGLDRIGSGLVVRGRALNEQVLLSGLYDFATLGIFSRAIGLATLLAGRIGSIAIMSLYPVVTRAERNSPRFRRLADLVLRGVVWTTVPAAAFLGLAAHDTVSLLYGAQWTGVARLLPLAVVPIGLGGITSALSSLLVANDNSRTALSLDVVAGLSGIALAIVLIPFGASTYLAGLGIHAVVIAGAAIALLLGRGAISARGVAAAFAPALTSGAAGILAVLAVPHALGVSENLAVRIVTDASAFGITHLAVLRIAFADPLQELLDVAPGGDRLARSLGLAVPL
jgi:O-antigen/teichoic acid export membrane protein